MIFILFCYALFDFIQLIISLNTSNFINLDSRLGGFLIIFNSLFYYFALKLPIRHQFFCLIAIGIYLLIIIITEFIFLEANLCITYWLFFLFLLYSFLGQFYCAMIDSNEKYLFDYNNLNPFYALLFEGFFGILFSIIYGIFYDPFKNIIKQEYNGTQIAILTISLIMYTIFSSLKNIYRVNTTKIFTPMITSSFEYLISPIFIIVDFSLGDDFMSVTGENYIYFFINLISSLLIYFFCLVFNDFIILFFCGIDKDTHQEISRRSLQDEKLIIFDETDDDDDEDKEKIEIKYI